MSRRLAAVLALALGLRLFHVGYPISGRDAWRQADTAAMARAFSREGLDLLHPAVDWRGAGPGWVQGEFPLYSWTMGLLGASPAAGRLLAIAGGLLAIYALYQLLRDMIDERTATWGALIMACSPVGVFYSRTVQPDAWMLAAQVGAIWLTRSALTRGPRHHGPLAVAAFTLACLLKPASAVLLLPLGALVVVHRGRAGLFAPRVLASVAVSAACVIAWYLWATHLGDLTELRFFQWSPGSDKWGHAELALSPHFWWTLLWRRLASHVLVGGLAAVLVAGLLFARNRREEWVLDAWLASVLIATAVTAAGQLPHLYYQLPLLPPAAAICGKVLGRHLTPALRWQSVLLAALVAAAIPTAAVRLVRAYGTESLTPPTLDAAVLVAEHVPAEALVITVSARQDPTLLYHVDRHGWILRPDQLDERTLDDLAAQGAAFLVSLEPPLDRAPEAVLGQARLYRLSGSSTETDFRRGR